MADALISPEVGGTMWAASAAAIVFCSKQVKDRFDDFKVPLMGIMGAFIFAGQMINFSIPGTGSSGHICGSILLAVLLGPYAALLVIASVLLVQSLIFADGGLLALGCNIANMGIFPCLMAYPLIYRKIAGSNLTSLRLWLGSIAASIVGLQMGAFAVVLETYFSGVSALPFIGFLLAMLPIHLAIGLVEGVITASVLTLIRNSRPELIDALPIQDDVQQRKLLRGIVLGLLGSALVIGGVFSWFASSNPDGLEWAIGQVTGGNELESPGKPVHEAAAHIQEKSSLLPDYSFKQSAQEPEEAKAENSWSGIDAGTSLSGIMGAIITLFAAMGFGVLLKRKNRIQPSE